MKKSRKAFYILLASLLAALAICIIALINYYNTPYAYPISPGTTEWNNLSVAERVQSCQIPEKLLKRMSTRALAKTIAEYPFLTDILAMSSEPEHVYDNVRNGFNGYIELEKRENGADELFSCYQELKQSDENFVKLSSIELILRNEIFYSRLSSGQRSELGN